jgi:hypothetical protein
MSITLARLPDNNNHIFNTNPFCALPPNTLYHIFSKLIKVRDLGALKLTDRHLCQSIYDSPTWKCVLSQYLPDSYVHSNLNPKDPHAHFGSKIWSNIRSSQYRIQRFRGHTNIIKDLQSDGNFLYSGAFDNTIRVWDPHSGKEIRKLVIGEGSPCAVLRIKIDEDLLYYGLYDGTIGIWDLNSDERPQTLACHGAPVSSLLIHKDYVCSASYNGSIKIWDRKSGKELHTLTGHKKTITSLKIYGNRLCSGSLDGTIRIWNLKSGDLLNTLVDDEKKPVNCILIRENLLYSGSQDGPITIWDLQGKNKPQELHGHLNSVESLLDHDNCLYSISWDKTFMVWDFKSKRPLETLSSRGTYPSNFLIHQGRFCFTEMSHNNIITWNHHFPPLSLYDEQILEKDWTALKKMAAYAEHADYSEDVEKLAETLHPDFKQRMREHSHNIHTSFVCSAEVILRVQTEVCVELLLHAIHAKKWETVSQLLTQLTDLDPQNAEIYDILCQTSYQYTSREWGKIAFHDKTEYDATLSQKEDAVIRFKQSLKERWGLPL